VSEPKAFDCSNEPLIPGVTLLEASAGTGKTYALARIFLRLVAEKGVEVGKILTVTFTTAATEELRERIRSLLVEAHETLQEDPQPEEDPAFLRLRNQEEIKVSKEECIRRIKLAITCFDEAIISTIHGFCSRVLSENALETESLFEAELDRESDKMAMEGVREFWRERFALAHPVVAAAASTEKLKPEDLAKFFNKLPSTQDYHLGFEEEGACDLVRTKLLAGFDSLVESWNEGRKEYLDYASTCLDKGTKPGKHFAKHADILNKTLTQGEVSPAGLKVLEDMRASIFKPTGNYLNEDIPKFALQVDSFWEVLKQFGRAVRVDCVRYLEDKIEKWKRERGLLSFDDLLSQTAQAVTSEGEGGDALRKSLGDAFDAAMIDEFQDTDPVQFEIFRELFGITGKHWLYLIGDPKQSIYRFRGADLEAYFDFAKKTNAVKYSLDTNFRTVTPLVGAVNAFFSESQNPFMHDDLSFEEVNPNEDGEADKEKAFAEGDDLPPPFVIREMEWVGEKGPTKTEIQEAIRLDMANEIHRLLEVGSIGGRKVRTNDLAILVRGNFEATEVWNYFRRRGLPAVVFTDVSLFDSVEAKELLWVLEGIVDSGNERSIKRALATGLLGMTSNDFQAWQDHPEEWAGWVGYFRDCLKTWRKEGVYVALRELFRETGAISLNLRRPDGERRVTNFLHLAEALHQATSNNPLSPSSLVVWLRTRMDDSESGGDEYQLRLESESDAISILTVHKSKGLEYPVVFLPSLSMTAGAKAKEFTYHRNDGKLVVDLKEVATDMAKEKGKLEDGQEDARVLYVGLTRAASRCYLYQAPLRLSEDERPPAQTRIMRSWAASLKKTEEEEVAVEETSGEIGEIVTRWIDSHDLSDQVEYRCFSPEQAEVGEEIRGEGEGNAGSEDLESAKWKASRGMPIGSIVSSFSGLVEQVDFDGRDLDAEPESEDRPEKSSPEESLPPIFEFDAGAHAGTFMHDIFEHLEFADPTSWDEFIKKKLSDHHYEPEDWIDTIKGMVEQVMGTELEPGLVLQSLERKDRMEEMEFYFPVNPGFLPELASALPKGCLLRHYLEGVAKSEKHRIASDGYLKGLVDLIFRADGKHYVLDWKSNKLNGRPDGFGSAQIEREMLDHHYILQYHLYVVATHRFLQSRLPDYSYEEHFGGVYYLFTRGMQIGSQSGIFRDLPDLSVIEALDQFLVQAK
jgi:exodeoxyribonuclease V beta subunit